MDPRIPEIPTERSKPPTKPEWEAASKINTAAEDQLPRTCRVKQAREWLGVWCSSNGGRVVWSENFGAKSSDWFLPDASVFTLLLRIRRGFDIRAELEHLQDTPMFLRVNWPPDSPRPLEISLGRKDTAAGVPSIEVMPTIPSGRSKVPTVADWRDAREVNTAHRSSRAAACRIRMVREWAKVSCLGGASEDNLEQLSSLGAKNSDYFYVNSADLFDLVFRLRQGTALDFRGNDFELAVKWPQTADVPQQLQATEIGR